MGLQALQDCKVRRCQWSKKEQGDLVAFLQKSTRGLHPLSNFGVFFWLQMLTKSTENSASLQVRSTWQI
jgi:hypothetical protein